MSAFKTGKETPAEQLLRMIEASPQGEGAMGRPAKDVPLSRLQDAVWGFVVRLWRRIAPARQRDDLFFRNVRLAQRVLGVVMVGLGLYVVVDLALVQPRPRLLSALTPEATETAASRAPQPEASVSLKPLGEYLAAFQQRNPFTGQRGALEQPAVKTARHRLDELASGLVVVGIDRGPSPVALIEHTGHQRTYVVKVGDEINGMVVKQISQEGVVISYEGEELVLP